MNMMPNCLQEENLRFQLDLVAQSYFRLIGMPLVDAERDIGLALWNAPRVIVAHGTQSDPIFFFGNRHALERFEATFDEFCSLPSRLSAEPVHQEERQALLDAVGKNNFIKNYQGVRISAKGRRFRIEQAIVWNLVDTNGACHGQAATFEQWTDLPS